MNNLDAQIAKTQTWLSALYLVGTFAVILIYELGLAHMSADQDKSFGNQINFLTGGALIVLYFWFQRARAAGIPDPSTTTTVTQQTTTPSPGVLHDPPTIPVIPPAVPPAVQLRDQPVQDRQ